MEIKKSGFYFVSKLKSKTIKIIENIIVDLFDDLYENKEIIIGKGSNLNIFGCTDKNYNINIFHEENSKSKINLLILGSEKNTKIKIHSNIGNNKSESDLNIVSLVNNSHSIEINSKISINKGISGSSGNIIQENIFLGTNGNIISIPELDIYSNQSKAKHSSKIEKISDEKLFYLRSRGIEKTDATIIMLESLINSYFKDLKSDIFENKILNNFKNYLLN